MFRTVEKNTDARRRSHHPFPFCGSEQGDDNPNVQRSVIVSVWCLNDESHANCRSRIERNPEHHQDHLHGTVIATSGTVPHSAAFYRNRYLMEHPTADANCSSASAITSARAFFSTCSTAVVLAFPELPPCRLQGCSHYSQDSSREDQHCRRCEGRQDQQ